MSDGGGDCGGGGYSGGGDVGGGYWTQPVAFGPDRYVGLPTAWARAYGELVENKRYSPDELFISISNSIKQHRTTTESHNSLYWRLVHLFIDRPDPKILEIDGLRLKQLTEFFDEDAATRIDLKETYRVSLEDLESIVNKALERRSETPLGQSS